MFILKQGATSKSAGFTLIELVIVIVLLGILSVTVAPKFINVQSDAKESVLRATAGAIRSASSMLHAKAIIQGKHEISEGERIAIDGKLIEVKYGFAEAIAESDGDIRDLLILDPAIKTCLGRNNTCADLKSSNIRFGYTFTQESACFVYYIEPGGTGGKEKEYVIGFETAGC